MINIINFTKAIRNCGSGFTKVRFDTHNLKKTEKIYQIYQIPSDEKIIAYCKKHFLGITANGSVFTDKAFYPRPASLTSPPSKGDLSPVRIDYLDFAEYLIIQGGEKEAVFMCNKHHSYYVCFNSLINKNTLGAEIRTVLQAIQAKLCEESSEAKEKLDNIADEYLGEIRTNLKNNRLLPDTRKMLEGLIFTESVRSKAIDLLAEGIYRLCDQEDYVSFIETHSGYMDTGKKERFINIPKEFIKRLTADLSNPDLIFPKDYLDLMLRNLQRSDRTEENRKYYIFACIRSNLIIEARMHLYNLIQDFGRKSAYLAEDFVCIYGNRQMQPVMKQIKNNQDISQSDYNIADGLGFTPLHYAIMLDSKKAINQLLLSEKFYNELPYSFSEEVKNLYAYTTLAYLSGSDLKERIVLDTSAEIIPLLHARRTLEKQKDEASELIEKLRWEAEKLGRKHNAQFIKDVFHGERRFFDDEETPEDKAYYEAKRQYEDSVWKLGGMRIDIDEKIQEIDNQAKAKAIAIEKSAFKAIKELESSSSPFIRLIMDLYKNNTKNIVFQSQSNENNITDLVVSNENPEHIISKILTAANEAVDFRIYGYAGFCFMLPDSIELNLPYRKIHLTDNGIMDEEIENETRSETGHYADYENSWFSPEAHTDEERLRKEYRILVKRYHPDTNPNPESTKIFLAIQGEYEEILRQK